MKEEIDRPALDQSRGRVTPMEIPVFVKLMGCSTTSIRPRSLTCLYGATTLGTDDDSCRTLCGSRGLVLKRIFGVETDLGG